MKTTKIIISTIVSTLLVSAIVYAATISGVMTQTIAPNDTMGAGWYQQMNDRMEQVCPGWVCTAGSSPSGAIIAFNLVSCPTGWSAADGGGGRPDLRWQFVRGLNATSSGIDPNRVLASAQVDMLKSHTHGYDALHNEHGGWSVSLLADYSLSWYTGNTPGKTTQSTGGAETRPRNVAFLYCIKN